MKFIFFLILNFTIFGSTLIKVGAYPFPPYLNINTRTGKTIEVIELLNKIQTEYKFELVLTSPERRYKDLGEKFDLMFFEDLNWNWKNQKIDSSQVFLKDEEVFITLAENYSGEDYFDNIKNKKILMISGFHYAFANYNTDKLYLEKNFKPVFSTSPEHTIEFLLNKRADIAIITKSFLTQYLKKFPEKKELIIISKNPDQIYNLSFIRSLKAPISLDSLDSLVKKLQESKKFQQIINE